MNLENMNGGVKSKGRLKLESIDIAELIKHLNYSEIGRAFNISHTTVAEIINNRYNNTNSRKIKEAAKSELDLPCMDAWMKSKERVYLQTIKKQ